MLFSKRNAPCGNESNRRGTLLCILEPVDCNPRVQTVHNFFSPGDVSLVSLDVSFSFNSVKRPGVQKKKEKRKTEHNY